MEYFYGIIFFVVLVIIIVGGAILRSVARQKAAELGAQRSAKRKQESREQSKPSQITVNDVIMIGLPHQQVQESLAKSKLLKQQPDGAWIQQSAFSKEHPFTVRLNDLGAETQISVQQYLSKNDVIDGDMYWSIVATHLHTMAKRTGAPFRYQPQQFQFENLTGGIQRHFPAQ